MTAAARDFPNWTRPIQRWPHLFALLLGAAAATGFAPLDWVVVTLVALAGWIALVAAAASARRAFTLGWAFGVGHFVLGLNWIATAFTYQAAMPAWLGWIAVVLLSLYLALYPALAAWGAWLLRARVRPRAGADAKDGGVLVSLSFVLGFAGLWILTEWLRSWVFTGFAWNPLGAALAGPLAAPAAWVGTYGLGAFLMLAAGGALLLACRAWRAAAALTLLLVAASLFSWVDMGGRQLNAELKQKTIGFRPTPVTVVQPNVGQQDKWVGDKADANFAKLARLTTPVDDRPRLILWPEAAIPDYLETGYPPVYYERAPAAARGRLTELMNPGDTMLLGALKLEIDRSGEVVGARNAVMTVHADGTLGPRYDKAHLVPYGEYLPMRPVLSALGLSRLAPGDVDFWPGQGPRTIDLPRFGRVGIQICYEIIFSGQVVDRAHRPAFLFNPSNDAWFGTWGPPQHLAQARLRAIEEGLPVIRATPTGISAVIDAGGRIVTALPMHRAGRIDTVLPPAQEPTAFARFGNMLPVGFALLLLVLAIANRHTGR